jgi:hypothetical protein
MVTLHFMFFSHSDVSLFIKVILFVVCILIYCLFICV